MPPPNDSMIGVEIAYASDSQQKVISLEVAADSSVLHAIEQSGILQQFTQIDLTTMKVGIFGRLVALTDPIQPGDRIEIYRPLQVDPKQKRRTKAQERGLLRDKN